MHGDSRCDPSSAGARVGPAQEENLSGDWSSSLFLIFLLVLELGPRVQRSVEEKFRSHIGFSTRRMPPSATATTDKCNHPPLAIPDRAQLSKAEDGDAELLGHLLLVARRVAKDLQLDKGFRIVINDGQEGGE